jgi:hypothetical protein
MGDNKYGKEQSFEEMAENAADEPVTQEEPKKEEVKTDETTE